MKFLPFFLAVALFAGADDTFVLRGVTVHPVTGPDVENASLLVVDGKIAEIGDARLKTPKTTKTIDAKGLHVYPGMIDSNTEVGMSEISSVRETSDVSELGDFKPQLRAGIAVNPASEHIPVIRANGIVAAMAVPDGGILAGQASLMRLDGWTWEEMAIRLDAAMHLRFPTVSTASFGPSGFSRASFSEARRNYEARLKNLSEYFERARRYQKAKAAAGAGFKPDLALEAMLPVLAKKVPVMISATRERAIKDAVAWGEKEGVRIVLAQVRRPGSALALLKEKNIPVILGPTQELPLEEDDPYDEAFTVPVEVHKAGVKFAFGSFGNQFSRNLPYQAATAVAFGLPHEEALKSVTLYPAQIWGVDDRMGSIEKGKSADIILTDGDPLEVKTNVKRMFIQGREVDLESKHTKLYKKYLARP
ncbi:MAG: amidohydrolase family protein [Bryobacterales bacterium]|nr:amidohydrolase family protein [Bryobacterales bacterium]